MPTFAYEARDESGHPASGVLQAGNMKEASRLLRQDGKVIIGLYEAEQELQQEAGPGLFKPRIKRDDIIYFATQLAVMIDTGVTLSEGLTAIADQTENPTMKGILDDLCRQVQGGKEFSAALEKYPKVFGGLFVSMVRASEATGKMGEMLTRLSDYMEQERDTLKKVKGALTYPICMMAFCLIVVVALLIFVLPRFKAIYEGKGESLPMPTMILITLSEGIITYWPLLLVGVVGSIIGLIMFRKSESGQQFFDGLKLKIPIIGGMFRKAYLARSLRTMATMVTSGVSMLDGLAITASTAGNYWYRKIWMDLSEQVRQGGNLTDGLMEMDLIPRTVTQMVSAGEKSGRLGLVMNRVAGFCENDLKTSVKTVTQMIEPLMIIMMGLIIGGIAIALLLPVFNISEVVAK
ncbi:MAG: type II secretion system F family protein [Phycisphaerae bacterium]